ncbi:MAG: hypothetical protein JWP13_182 [Candidatus Saccharibacteria bacterium]|nr:hypothetical protein [Candidatus Saccharibacteria bacterium]
MEVLRATDGSYVFTFSKSEEPVNSADERQNTEQTWEQLVNEESGETEPLCWAQVEAYFLSHVGRLIAEENQDSAMGPEEVRKQFVLMENLGAAEEKVIGFVALRLAEVSVPERSYPAIPMPSMEIELPASESDGVPVTFAEGKEPTATRHTKVACHS